MKRTTTKKLALAGWLLAGCTAQALAGQEVTVGRVDVQLPGEGWQVHSVEDKGNPISGDGHTHQQSAAYKVMVRRGPDQVLDAIVMVRASASGIGRFSGLMFSNIACDGASNMYAEGDKPGVTARSYRCLKVVASQPVPSASALPEDVREIVSTLGWRLPPTMFVVSATQYATTGSFAVVVAYLRPLATTPPDKAPNIPEALPSGVTAASVQWGRQLQEAVTDAVYSIRGKLAFPDMPFAEGGNGFPAKPAGAETQNPASPARVPASSMADRG